MNTQPPDNLPEAFSGWAILELFGKTVLGGYVTEVSYFGAAMLRLDVPAIGDIPAWSKIYNPSSIFALTPCGEDEAKIVALKRRARPLPDYILPAVKPLTPRLLAAYPPDPEQVAVEMEVSDEHWDEDDEVDDDDDY